MKGDTEPGYPIYLAAAVILGCLIAFVILLLITFKAIGFPPF